MRDFTSPRTRRRRPLWLAVTIAFTGSCIDFGPLVDAPEMSTHVDDWRDEVIYQVLVDRFANGDAGNDYRIDRDAPARYHGGDWQGLEQNLSYLEALGVTTIWISPVVRNVETDADVDGYHGYWAQDFTSLNPHFGDMIALRRLVDAAHQREMKVIIDIVTNHVGQAFYYDINLNGNPDERLEGNGIDSPVLHINEYDPDFDPRGVQAFTSLGEAGPAPAIFVRDPATNHMPPLPELFQSPAVYNRRGRTIDFEDPDQLLHGDFPGGLKDVNTTRCDVKQTFVDVYADIVEQTDVDGFRVDTIKHVEYEFWRYFTQALRARLKAGGKEKFFIFGEAFDGRDDLVGSFTRKTDPAEDEQSCSLDGTPITGDVFDSAFYFPQHFQAVRDVFQQAQSTDRIQTLWEQRATNWGGEAMTNGVTAPPNELPVNFIDNHDVPRFLYGVAEHDAATRRKLLHNALAFVYTAQGVPCLYYGTEQEFDGGNDPANREDLWDSGFETGGATFGWIATLASARRSYASLRRGDLVVTWSTSRTGDEQDAGMFAFERNGGNNANGYALVVFNTHQGQESATEFEGAAMTVRAPAGTLLEDAFEHSTVTVSDTQTVTVTLPPMSVGVFVPAADIVGL